MERLQQDKQQQNVSTSSPLSFDFDSNLLVCVYIIVQHNRSISELSQIYSRLYCCLCFSSRATSHS